MRALLILLVLLGVAYYFFEYRKGASQEKAATEALPGSAAATPDSHSFDGVVALLRADMNAIPRPLDGPGPALANAWSIKRKLRPYVANHPEYATLTKVCDLIIQADTQRNADQASCRSEQGRLGFKTSFSHDDYSLDYAPSKGKPTPTPVPVATAQAEVRQRFESSWSNYRAQTDRQVQGLLDSLAGKRL